MFRPCGRRILDDVIMTRFWIMLRSIHSVGAAVFVFFLREGVVVSQKCDIVELFVLVIFALRPYWFEMSVFVVFKDNLACWC